MPFCFFYKKSISDFINETVDVVILDSNIGINLRIVYKKTDEWYIEWQRVTTNDNEWQRVVQRVTTSSTTSDNEWPQVTTSGVTSDKEWQWVIQRVTTSDNK